MLTLNTIKKGKGTAKGKKRVGRGNSSGRGTYSTRGLKGQKARSGVSNLKRLGMKQQLLQTPKLRGFKSLRPKNTIVSLKDINNNYKDGETVTPDTLIEKGIIDSKKEPIKILGKDKLTVKVKFDGVKMSAGAKEQTK